LIIHLLGEREARSRARNTQTLILYHQCAMRATIINTATLWVLNSTRPQLFQTTK